MLTKLVGIDGCRGGWLLAIADAELASVRFALEPTFEQALRLAGPGEALVAVDMPIGLPERGPRACDLAARALLGRPRASSVFPAPPRAALEAVDYAESCRQSFQACGKRLSRQLFNILSSIRQVDMAMTPELQARVREVHPEVVFATLAGTGRGLAHAKRTPEGERERQALLGRAGLWFEPGAVRARLGPSRVARDDLVDAAACLLAAQRMAAGRALVLPSGEVPRDRRGLRMEIVA